MNRQLSIYLDLLRFIAAALVFLTHIPQFIGGYLWQIAGMGHEAVVFFFVLSGFVIAYVCYDKKETIEVYSENRFSRIYSVALPAIFMTVFLYYAGKYISGNDYELYGKEILNPAWTIFSALFFVNQSWMATTFYTNAPYWSLGYEVLYYLFFGFLIYSRGLKRIILILLVMAVMGPSILLYLPIWLMGVVCFRMLGKYNLKPLTFVFLYLISIIGIIVLSYDGVQEEFRLFFHTILGANFFHILLEPAQKFGSDYVLGLFVSLHIFSSVYIGRKINIFNSFFEKIIKNISRHTFALYLYHMPMLYFVSIVLPYEQYPFLSILICCIMIPLIIFILSNYLEDRKFVYKKIFRSIIKIVEKCHILS